MVDKDRENKIITTLANCADFGDPQEYYKKLLKLREEVETDNDKLSLIKIMEALGNKDRFIMVDMLREKDRCVCELEAIIDKSQGTISRHLKVLENANLIQGWKHGKFTHYSLVKPIFDRFLELVSNWADKTTNWFGTLPAISET